MKKPMLSLLPVVLCALSAIAACSPAGDSGEGEGEGDGPAACTDPEEVPCRDDSFQTLAMTDVVNPRVITDDVVGDAHEVVVDATAGGFGAANPDGFLYGKFTDDGFVKVDVDDDASFDSMDWDVAFRRFVIRLNSGVSGPSCVAAADVGDNDAFNDVTTTPDAGEFNTEEYFNDECTLTPDGSGLETAPATVLQNFWKYSQENCLQMTEHVYVVALADGRAVKMEVTGYYDPVSAQDSCNDTGSLPNDYTSAKVRFRWTFL